MTDRKPFETIGPVPRWQQLYDLVMSKKVGEEITYREAIELLGLDPRTERARRIVLATMRETMARLERHGERTVGTVAKFGWIVLDAQRELHQVDRRLTKTHRAAGRVIRGAQALNTRREELSQFERERLDRISYSASMASQVTGRRQMDLNTLRKMIESGQATG